MIFSLIRYYLGVELPVYDCSKHYLLPYLSDGVYNHFVSSMAAGLATAVASTPIDVIKTRMMNQRNLKPQALAASTSMTILCPLVRFFKLLHNTFLTHFNDAQHFRQCLKIFLKLITFQIY